MLDQIYWLMWGAIVLMGIVTGLVAWGTATLISWWLERRGAK